jgi:N6-adenosine-specific RNA methylase IME4
VRKSRPNQTRDIGYDTLELGSIKDILSKYESKVLFLWTIDKYLYEAEDIGKSLGYKLHARIIWDKCNGVAPAYTVRYTHEYLLWLYRSPMLEIDERCRGKYTTVMREQSKGHSIKPACAYEMIEALYPNCSRVELFARNRRAGWESFGNELGTVL